MSSKICQRCRKVHRESGNYCLECVDIRQENKASEPPKKRDKVYGTNRWKETSKRHRKREPLCRMCLAEGRVTPWQVTDHIVEIKDGGDRFDKDNLQSLCNSCHGAKTAKTAKERGDCNVKNTSNTNFKISKIPY